MPDRREPSPTLRRRRLAAELRGLRAASGLSAAEVARRLKWGDTKPLYLENNQGVRPDPNDVALLCDVYEVSGEKREELIKLAEDGRLRGWWHPYSKMLSRAYTTLIGLEAEADEVLVFEPSVLHGLVQTEEYAKALIAEGGPSEVSDLEVKSRVKVRAERQRILTRPDQPARLSVILDEAAIRRKLGGPDVMRAQLEHLLELVHRPNIDIRVVPFNAGAHPGVAGSFSILRFADAADAPAVYIETIAGELFIEEEAEVVAYSQGFVRLQEKALKKRDTIAVIAAAAATI